MCLLGRGCVYSFDPVGSYQREEYRAGGSAGALLQPLLDNQVEYCVFECRNYMLKAQSLQHRYLCKGRMTHLKQKKVIQPTDLTSFIPNYFKIDPCKQMKLIIYFRVDG